METAIQLYTLRHLDEPLVETIARVGQTEFDAVELAGLGEATPAAVRSALAEAGLTATAAHVSIEDLEEDLEETVGACRAIGCERVVVPWLPPEAFVDRVAVEETAHRLSAVGDRVRDRGLAFSYHNHTQEFRPVDGTSAVELLADVAGQLTFELDAGWALAAGRDPVELVRELGDRTPLLHLKDVAVGAGAAEASRYATDAHRPVELGEGDLDPADVVAAAAEVGAGWACYEHDDPDDPMESLRHGSETVEALV